MTTRQPSHADPYNIVQREFEEELDAKRVVIVGGIMPEFKMQMPESSGIKIEKIEVPVIVKEVQIERVEVPVIVKEVQIVEVEKIIVQKELQIERVEIPVVVKEIQEVIKEVPVIQTEVKLIEVPVIVKEVQIQSMSSLVKACLAVHAATTIILLLKLILK